MCIFKCFGLVFLGSSLCFCSGSDTDKRKDGSLEFDRPPLDAPLITDAISPDAPAACGDIAVDATVTAHIRITTDDECEVYVNGENVGGTTSWSSPVDIDVSLFLHPGRRNVIAIMGQNLFSQSGNDRGIIGELRAAGDARPENPILHVTDDTWRVAQTVDENWMNVDYDDSDWPLATAIANNGDSPWGAVFGASTAKWIWFAAVPASTNDKPTMETTYARSEFFFSVDGMAVGPESSCP